MDNKGQAFFDAASKLGNRLKGAFAVADENAARDEARFANESFIKKTEEPGFDAVVAAANRFLQGFPVGSFVELQNILTNARFGGSVSDSVLPTSNAPNYDTGMGGSTKEKEKKDSFYEELMWRNLIDNWARDFDSITDPYEKYKFSEKKFKEATKDFARDAKGNIQWDVEAKKAGINLPGDALRRRPGESEEDYQARVLKALETEVLDENGNVKEKYKGKKLAAAVWAGRKMDETRPAAEQEAIRRLQDNRQIILDQAEKQRQIEAMRRELSAVERLPPGGARDTALSDLLYKYHDTVPILPSDKEQSKEQAPVRSIQDVREQLNAQEQSSKAEVKAAVERNKEIEKTCGNIINEDNIQKEKVASFDEMLPQNLDEAQKPNSLTVTFNSPQPSTETPNNLNPGQNSTVIKKNFDLS